MLKHAWKSRRKCLFSHYFYNFEESIVALKSNFISYILVLTLSQIRLMFFGLYIGLTIIVKISITKLERKSSHDSLTFLNRPISVCSNRFQSISIRVKWIKSHNSVNSILSAFIEKVCYQIEIDIFTFN
jgi:hypothetical protein